MNDPQSVQFTVWGCRGSHAAPGPETLRYGGETTCYELKRGVERLWIDAGTGLRRAAQDWISGGAPGRPHILLSHLHLDHLLGLGALAQHLSPERPAVLFFAGDLTALRDALNRLFAPPFWPVALHQNGLFELRLLDPKNGAQIGATRVRAFALNHPGGCFGFELETADARVVIAADHEHGRPEIDREVERRARGADLLIYDAAYSAQIYASRIGWGHSTREEGLRLARRARSRL